MIGKNETNEVVAEVVGSAVDPRKVHLLATYRKHSIGLQWTNADTDGEEHAVSISLCSDIEGHTEIGAAETKRTIAAVESLISILGAAGCTISSVFPGEAKEEEPATAWREGEER